MEQGIDPARVLKRASGGGDCRGTPATDAELLAAATAPVEAGAPGLLLGGTAWDLVSDKRVPAGSLDLLVIDEAGQFSVTGTAGRVARPASSCSATPSSCRR
ncbi:MAG: hypothetical protein R2702_06785 [Acidimicrobiales bacterium]